MKKWAKGQTCTVYKETCVTKKHMKKMFEVTGNQRKKKKNNTIICYIHQTGRT